MNDSYSPIPNHLSERAPARRRLGILVGTLLEDGQDSGLVMANPSHDEIRGQNTLA